MDWPECRYTDAYPCDAPGQPVWLWVGLVAVVLLVFLPAAVVLVNAWRARLSAERKGDGRRRRHRPL